MITDIILDGKISDDKNLKAIKKLRKGFNNELKKRVAEQRFKVDNQIKEQEAKKKGFRNSYSQN